jgi:large subunit ribosomal protein L10
MNREQKAAAIEEVAGQIQESEAVFAVDYRGISVPQAAELRTRLTEAGARFRVVKNTLTIRAVDQAGVEGLKEVLEGPTAFTFVLADGGDVALAAKALATFRREHDVLAFKGGVMNGDALTVDQLEALSKLPARDVLHQQLVGMIASPITGLVRGLNALISGLAIQLGQIRDQGLVGGDAPAEEPAAEETPAAEEAPAEDAAAEDSAPAEDAPAEDAAPAEEPAAEEASAESEEAPGEEASAEEPAADETAPEPEADAEGDGTETDETDAPSEGDETD